MAALALHNYEPYSNGTFELCMEDLRQLRCNQAVCMQVRKDGYIAFSKSDTTHSVVRGILSVRPMLMLLSCCDVRTPLLLLIKLQGGWLHLGVASAKHTHVARRDIRKREQARRPVHGARARRVLRADYVLEEQQPDLFGVVTCADNTQSP